MGAHASRIVLRFPLITHSSCEAIACRHGPFFSFPSIAAPQVCAHSRAADEWTLASGIPPNLAATSLHLRPNARNSTIDASLSVSRQNRPNPSHRDRSSVACAWPTAWRRLSADCCTASSPSVCSSSNRCPSSGSDGHRQSNNCPPTSSKAAAQAGGVHVESSLTSIPERLVKSFSTVLASKRPPQK